RSGPRFGLSRKGVCPPSRARCATRPIRRAPLRLLLGIGFIAGPRLRSRQRPCGSPSSGPRWRASTTRTGIAISSALAFRWRPSGISWVLVGPALSAVLGLDYSSTPHPVPPPVGGGDRCVLGRPALFADACSLVGSGCPSPLAAGDV